VQLEDGLKLDLNRLVRRGLMLGGPVLVGALAFGARGAAGAAYNGFFVLILPTENHGSLTLGLGALTQKVALVAKPRHFGGQQWYALCPINGSRVSVLWMPPGKSSFASSEGWGPGFGYRSQFEAPLSRAATQAQNIRFRLGGEAFLPIFDGLPPRPRYMHQRRYEAQLKRLEVFERKCYLYLGLDDFTIPRSMTFATGFDWPSRGVVGGSGCENPGFGGLARGKPKDCSQKFGRASDPSNERS
jgi:hypothetical protein